MDIKELVDDRHQQRTPSELVDAPIHVIRGVSEQDADLIQQAFGTKTVHEFANLSFIQLAQNIVALAEGKSENGELSLEELQKLQSDAEKLQDSLEAMFLELHKEIKRRLERFLEKLKDKGFDLPKDVLDSIGRELRDIRQKEGTIRGLQSRVSVFKDLIELKKALIETADNEGVKRILTEQKVTEILLKNQVLLQILIITINLLVEILILETKLN